MHTEICWGCIEVARGHKYLVPEKSTGHHVIFRRSNPREYDPDLWTL